MGRRRDPSWLLNNEPPTRRVGGEQALWWAVIRQAARDLRYSHQSEALDALEFLRGTGQWLTAELFGIPDGEYQREVVKLIQRRRSMKGESTSLQSLLLDNRFQHSF